MTKSLTELKPYHVWRLFEKISSIPRQSKKEDLIRVWVKEWGKKNEIKIEEDQVGNLLLHQNATKGFESFPGVILQAHMDMVAQKTPDSNHDFNKDPIQVIINENFVRAEKTTLGADNGIGMAMILAVLIDPTVKHGPVDILLTVDEETGLSGAFALKSSFFQFKNLINLDSEDEGEITTGSAGGGDTKVTFSCNLFPANDLLGYQVSVNGLKGGHSGIDIHLPRLNAIKICIDIVEQLQNQGKDVFIENIQGGSAHNAIPRDCTINFGLRSEKDSKKAIVEIIREKIIQYRKIDPKIVINLDETNIKTYIKESKNIIELLSTIEHGPLTYSKSIPDLVETSNNLAVVKSNGDFVEISVSSRSSINSELNHVRSRIKRLSEKLGGSIELGKAYPGWNPDLNSSLLKLVQREYSREYQKEVKLKAIHAGLECGLFKGIVPDLEIVSFGPEIKGSHSPDERVNIRSVELIWNVLCSVLEKFNEIESI